MRDDQLQPLVCSGAIPGQLSCEYLSNRPGTEIVVIRLTEVLIVELVRMNCVRCERNPPKQYRKAVLVEFTLEST